MATVVRGNFRLLNPDTFIPVYDSGYVDDPPKYGVIFGHTIHYAGDLREWRSSGGNSSSIYIDSKAYSFASEYSEYTLETLSGASSFFLVAGYATDEKIDRVFGVMWQPSSVGPADIRFNSIMPYDPNAVYKIWADELPFYSGEVRIRLRNMLTDEEYYTGIYGTSFRGDVSIGSPGDYYKLYGPDVRNIVNVYCTNRPESLERGQSYTLEYEALYGDGQISPYDGEMLYDTFSPANGSFRIEGNTIIVDDNIRATGIGFNSKPTSEFYTGNAEIFYINISNPLGEYDSGGNSVPSISQGMSQGSYDNTFGPNISGMIPGLDSSGNSLGGGGSVGNDVSLSGMYTKYLCNQSYLNLLAQFFWEDNVGIQALKLVFGNPIESVISLISYPFNLETLLPTRRQNFFFGKYDSLMSAIAITRSSFQIDWGTIQIPFYWGNFLDYAPYTKVQLYLPWGVGFVSIDPNEIMPYSENPTDYNSANYKQGSIRVVTNVEVDKGSCVHNVIGNRGLVIGSFAGICGKQIPMTALDTSAKMLALLGAASGIGSAAGNAMSGAMSGRYTTVTPATFSAPNGQVGVSGFNHRFNAGQMLSDIGSSRTMKGGLASAAALAATPPNYPRAGTFSDATNTMGVQVPYLIISRPAQSVPTNYGHYNGYPSNIYYQYLSMVSGYTELSEIHLDNIPATVDELNELDSLLKGGVLL